VEKEVHFDGDLDIVTSGTLFDVKVIRNVLCVDTISNLIEPWKGIIER
jgi:hypothetical protein